MNCVQRNLLVFAEQKIGSGEQLEDAFTKIKKKPKTSAFKGFMIDVVTQAATSRWD
jgi:hypothetical protein